MTGGAATTRGPDDRGETLLELVISLCIIGIAVVAVLAAVRLAVDASSFDQRRVEAKSALRSWSETIAARVTDASYLPCASASAFAAAFGYDGPARTGYTASVAQVQYWNGTAFTSGSGGGGACVAGDDTGTQRVLLRMTVADSIYPGFTSQLWVTVRKPCGTTSPC
ncbi:MAG TPA: hypothetical protein VI248_23795 [Kineosporiaceae bacterium]